MEKEPTQLKIIKILNTRGPSLPIQIGKEMNMNSLFASAFLSELSQEKKVKISNLKVGGSPLYYLLGQEEQLINFIQYLHPKETEAFNQIKEKKLLKDVDLEPAIRIAMRSIRDFAIGFKKDDEIYWKYFLDEETPTQEIPHEVPVKSQEESVKSQEVPKEITPPPINDPTPQKETTPSSTKTPKKESKETTPSPTKTLEPIKQPSKQNFVNPLIIQKESKPKPQFIQNIISEISKNYKIIEELNFKVKEYNCIIQIRSELGPINFLTKVKDKKKISETDLKNHLSDAQKIPLPALYLHTGNLSKKGIELTEKYASILKVKKIN